MNDYGFKKWMELRDMMNGASFAFDLKLESYRKNNPPPQVTGVVDDSA